MIPLGLATFVVMLVAGALLVIGALVLNGARRKRGGPACPRCGHANAQAAHYCGQCGHTLEEHDRHS